MRVAIYWSSMVQAFTVPPSPQVSTFFTALFPARWIDQAAGPWSSLRSQSQRIWLRRKISVRSSQGQRRQSLHFYSCPLAMGPSPPWGLTGWPQDLGEAQHSWPSCSPRIFQKGAWCPARPGRGCPRSMHACIHPTSPSFLPVLWSFATSRLPPCALAL